MNILKCFSRDNIPLWIFILTPFFQLIESLINILLLSIGYEFHGLTLFIVISRLKIHIKRK